MRKNLKKKLIVSYKNLSEELLSLFKETYPEGHSDFVQKTIKPNGEPIFVVPLETEDATYMVKVEVKIDTSLAEEDLDNELYGDEGDTDKGDDVEFAPLSEALAKDDGAMGGRNDRVLKHGDYEDVFSIDETPSKRGRGSHSNAGDEIMKAFDDMGDDDDEYADDRYEDDDDDYREDEPSDEDLLDIDLNDLEEMPELDEPKQPAKRGRKKKSETAAATEPAPKRGRPAKKTTTKKK